MTAQGFNPARQPPPAATSAELDFEGFQDPNEAHARWQSDSQARGGAGGGALGEPRGGQKPPRQAAPERPVPPSRPYGQAPAGGAAAGAPPQAAAYRAQRVFVPGATRAAAPGFTPPPVEARAEQRPPAAAHGFARAIGIPAGAPPPPRPKSARWLEPSDLEPVSREAVRVWKALSEAFPGYFHAPELNQAVFEFLNSVLGGEGGAGGRQVTLEIRRKIDGNVESREFFGPEITIGSHAQNTLQLMAAQVSRRHARIVHDERGFCLCDQGSSNGTYLRGERLQPGFAYPLKNGETFTIPGFDIEVKWPEGSAVPKLAAVRVASVRVVPAARFFEECGAQAFVASVRLDPMGLRLFIEVDLPLASLFVSRVLGAEAPAPGASASTAGAPIRPLSELERGVLELLFVKLLDAIQAAWAERAEVSFHLEGVFETRDPALGERAPASGHAIVATVGLDFDTRRDTVRVALPDAALAAIAPKLGTAVPRAGESSNELFQRLRDAVGFAKVEIRGVIGRSKLTRTELAALSIGDIIIPDELTVKATEAGLGGRVDLVMGPRRGKTKIRGELIGWDGQLFQVQLDEFLTGDGGDKVSGQDMDLGAEQGGEETQGVAPVEGQDGGAEAEGAQVLNDVPLPLVVELGRLYLTVRDIAALRRGQVIELGRSPSEPVALVVEGHVVGAGKLVNVEGEIGVQITNLQQQG